MPPSLHSRFRLEPLADTLGDRFRDFAPYVASINSRGVVAFQATLRDGSTGLFTCAGEGAPCVAAAAERDAHDYRSHPDIAASGAVSAYADHASGAERVVRIAGESRTILADTRARFTRIGPLGPTMNDAGLVAFRADTASGPGVFVSDGARCTEVAGAPSFRAFHGLPVIDRDGAVLFRADARDGTSGVYLWRPDRPALATVVDTRGPFASLGAFPCRDDAGFVTYTAMTRDGLTGVFRAAPDGRVATVIDTSARFESVRGALTSVGSPLVVFATPRGGSLGLYVATGSSPEKVLAIGDHAFGSTVREFALNPVSLNDAAQIALRLALDDGTQRIVRVALA